MEILLVEDDSREVRSLQRRIPGVHWRVAATKAEAFAEIASAAPDLVICDLRIPPDSVDLDAHTDHGLAVFDRVRLEWPGVPILVFSGFSDIDMLDERLAAAPTVAYRRAVVEPLCRHVKKDAIDKAIADVELLRTSLAALDEVEISWGGAPDLLEAHDRRVLRLYAQQRGAALVRARALKQGNSGSLTLALTLQEGVGEASHAVTKLNTIEEVEDEASRYRANVAERVELGAYTPLTEVIVAGAGARGGLFYRLADGFDRNLFDLLRSDPEAAATVVSALRVATRAWLSAGSVEQVDVGWVRKCLVRDEIFGSLKDRAPWGNETLEGRRLEVLRARQHGDLHGENVLIDPVGRPVLIDFGRAGHAISSLDPVTLELSALLHPEAKLDLSEWLTPGHAECWADRGQFVVGSPITPFIEACRSWAYDVARGDREVLATAYAYTLRQMRYPHTDQQLVAALNLGTARALERLFHG